MKYYIENEEVTEEVFRDRLEEETRNYVEENLDDLIDECCEPTKIGTKTFTASQILRECDPIAYNCIADDFVDGFLEDYIYAFDRPSYDTINHISFETTAEDEEESEEEE